jgi:glycosyltransferase involved in cell wall biosynthesis
VISVVLNSYNYAAYVGAAIGSVLAQTRGDFELIVVDDGSTDGSREVIRSFRDRRIRVVERANGGQGAALLEGIGEARGEIIALLDSDDVWDAGKLEACMEVFGAERGISLLCHGFRCIDAGGRETGERTVPGPGGPFDALRAYERLEMGLPYVPTSFIAGEARFFRAVRFEPAAWRIAADTPLIAGLSVMGRVWLLDEVLGGYRVHGGNAFHGRRSEAELVALRGRFYDAVNAQLGALGRAERFDFRRSPDHWAQEVLRHPAWTWRGLRSRWAYRVALARKRRRSVF